MKKIAIASLVVGIGGCAFGIAGFVVGLADLGSTEGENGIPWTGLILMVGFLVLVLGIPALEVLSHLLSKLIDALETKWSRPRPDRPTRSE